VLLVTGLPHRPYQRRSPPDSGVVINYLGIDIGGTKVAIRAEGDDARPREAAFYWPSPADVTEDLAALISNIGDLRDRWGKSFDTVGVAMPATLDSSRRVTAWPGRPVWQGLDLDASLRDLFPDAVVRCADDGDLAAIAEADRANCGDLVYLGVGTGVGGGIVVDGRPIPGPERGSCELGHVIVDISGPRCDCGRRGCVQATASGPATLRRAADLKGTPVRFEELRDGFIAAQPWAVSAVEASCVALAAAVVSLGELVHPDLVLIGGGFAAGMPGFVPAVAANARRLTRTGAQTPLIDKAALGGFSSLHGALLLARREESA
jgi:kanosamine 6-kinase